MIDITPLTLGRHFDRIGMTHTPRLRIYSVDLMSGIHTAFKDPNQFNLFLEDSCYVSQSSLSLYRNADDRIW